ncbi:4Fe-4S dicluster domain-containing protein [Candidatus Poribacteria bacterium]|nr:4Fe-4S dicluster domain-containing protein [Candidatus Poribacteria bacterium]
MGQVGGLLSSDVWESIAVRENLCSRSLYPASTCDLCMQSCPSGSIMFENGLPLVSRGCSDCGTCASSCPNGVFRPKKGDDIQILAPLLRHLAEQRMQAIAYACVDAGQTCGQTLSFTCLGRLTESLIIGPFVFGAKSLRLSRGNCARCKNGRSLSNQSRIITNSRLLAHALRIDPDRICADDEAVDGHEEDAAERKALSIRFERRWFFRALKSDGAAFVGGLLSSVRSTAEAREEKAAAVNWRRRNLLSLLFRAECSSDGEVSGEQLPAAEVSVGPRCTGCRLCGFLCPTKAIRTSQHDDMFEMVFDPHLCTACGSCERACLFKAIKLKPTFNLKNLFEQKTEVLLKSPLKQCRRCGAGFIHSTDSTCQLCLSKNTVQNSHIHRAR